ncbi:MAG: acyl-CoA dehydrogenase [Desulfosudis oleivorans]|nr:acyl-CoA dehydrogenase [Desulfosudis oleivorans]
MDMHGLGIKTRARLDGDEWVINGSKVWPTNSGIADLYLVVCNTDSDLGDDGIAMIYVPAPIDGFSFGRFEDKAGFRASRRDFYFDNVRVPREYRVAGPGRDAELLHDNIVFARIFSSAWAVGIAQGAFDEVLAFTRDKLAGGQAHQAAHHCSRHAGRHGHRATGGKGRLRQCHRLSLRSFQRSTGHAIPNRCSPGPPSPRSSAATWRSQPPTRAMEPMGSYGYVTDYHVEKYWRDVKIIQLWEGGAQLGRLDVARGIYDL